MDRKRNAPLTQLVLIIKRLLISSLIVLLVHPHDELANFMHHFVTPFTSTDGLGGVRIRPLTLLAAATSCPVQCSCLPQQVNCHNASHRDVPHMLDPKLRVLDMSNNLIKDIGTSHPFSIYPLLVQLNLSRNLIHQLRPDGFKSNKRLEILSLDGNRISSLSKASFDGLESLKVLKLSNNTLQSAKSFGQLNKLETLDLANNEINELSVDVFKGMASLKYLSLRHNKLGHLVHPPDKEYFLVKMIKDLPSVAKKMPVLLLYMESLSPEYLLNLTKLDLGLNGFTVIAEDWSPFGKMDGELYKYISNGRKPSKSIPFIWYNLQELFLDGCFIEYIENGSFAGLASLLVLKLNSNSLLEIPTEAFKDLLKLEVLQIGRNHFTSIETSSFAGLRQLRSLDLSGSSYLKTIKPGAFKGNVNLERLDLSLNPNLLSLHVDTFEGLSNLKYLFLRGNNLTTFQDSLLPIGYRLELLDISDNSFKCDCKMDAVRKLLVTMRNKTNYQLHPSSNSHRQLAESRLLFLETGLSRTGSTGSGVISSARANDDYAVVDPTSPSFRSFLFAATEVKCKEPDSLRGQLLINLDPEDLGCNDMEWLTITIALIVVCVIIAGVVLVCWCRCRRRLVGESEGQGRADCCCCSCFGSTSMRDKSNSISSRNRKLFHLHTNRNPIYDLDNIYSKPDFIVVSKQLQPAANGHEVPVDENVYENEEEEVRQALQPKKTTSKKPIPSTDL